MRCERCIYYKLSPKYPTPGFGICERLKEELLFEVDDPYCGVTIVRVEESFGCIYFKSLEDTNG